ncbi:MAG: DedA family protein [Rhodobacteraceae bacterium]|nr:DedA family protein [Paracoccaceae bacterium]
MFRRLYYWTVGLAASDSAPAALGLVSFVESSVFPIPADVLFVPMCAARPDRAMRYALLATVTSVLGGILGWLIGYYAYDILARPILEFWGAGARFDALRADATAGAGLVLVLLLTSGLAHVPPMKVVTILSGVIAFSLPLFVLSAILARGARFFALGWLMRRYGTQVLTWIEPRVTQIALGVTGLALLLWAAERWLA